MPNNSWGNFDTSVGNIGGMNRWTAAADLAKGTFAPMMDEYQKNYSPLMEAAARNALKSPYLAGAQNASMSALARQMSNTGMAGSGIANAALSNQAAQNMMTMQNLAGQQSQLQSGLGSQLGQGANVGYNAMSDVLTRTSNDVTRLNAARRLRQQQEADAAAKQKAGMWQAAGNLLGAGLGAVTGAPLGALGNLASDWLTSKIPGQSNTQDYDLGGGWGVGLGGPDGGGYVAGRASGAARAYSSDPYENFYWTGY